MNSVLHTGFSSNFGGTNSRSAAIVSNNRIIKEESILVVVILWPGGRKAGGLAESLSGGLTIFSENRYKKFGTHIFVFDLVLIFVDGTGRSFCDVFLNS